MSITKVGSSYNFIYNTKTGKLSTKDGSKNGYYELSGTTASPLFNVTAGGSVQGLYKVEVKK